METTKEEAIRNFILQKSESLFVQNGYERTSMDMIARECDLSKPTLYNYFRGKADLFMGIHVLLHESINAIILRFLKQDPPSPAVLEEIVDAIFGLVGEHRDFFRVFNLEYHHLTHEKLSEHIDWSITNRRKMSRTMVRFLDPILQPEAKNRFGTETVAAVLLSVCDMMFFDLAVNEADRVETYKELVFHILKNSVLRA